MSVCNCSIQIVLFRYHINRVLLEVKLTLNFSVMLFHHTKHWSPFSKEKFRFNIFWPEIQKTSFNDGQRNQEMVMLILWPFFSLIVLSESSQLLYTTACTTLSTFGILHLEDWTKKIKAAAVTVKFGSRNELSLEQNLLKRLLLKFLAY